MLYYRFPGKEIVSRKGCFKPNLTDDIQGFILSDFNQKNKFVFTSSSLENNDVKKPEVPFVISKEDYIKKASEIIEILSSNQSLKKIVYSRIKEVSLSTNGFTLFERLTQAYPRAFVYYFQDPQLGEWIGASPEILVSGKNGHFESVALAGTQKANETRDWGEKEKEEQAFVSHYLAELLQNHNVSDLRSEGPKTVQAGPLSHLRTDFQWKSDSLQAWQIAKDLHPTPAVSGTPVQEASEWILNNEKHDRSFYSGMIGELQAEEMNIFVNLRCAQIIGDRIFLYIGGGFTAESDPEKEWEETENKSKTLLNLL